MIQHVHRAVLITLDELREAGQNWLALVKSRREHLEEVIIVAMKRGANLERGLRPVIETGFWPNRPRWAHIVADHLGDEFVEQMRHAAGRKLVEKLVWKEG